MSPRLSILGASGSLGSLLQASLRPPPNPLLRAPTTSLSISVSSGPFVTFPSSPPLPPSDLVVVTTKSYDVISAVSTLPPRSKVLVLCNGLVPLLSDLRRCSNVGRLYVGTTSVGARKLSDGGTLDDRAMRRIEVAENGRGATVLGQLGGRDGDGGDDDLAFFAGTMNDAGFATKVMAEGEVLKALWLKMFVNCLVNPGCAVRGVPNGKAVLEPKLVEEVRRVRGWVCLS